MTQTQMTAYLADKIGISKRQAKSTLDELNELVSRQLKREGSLRLAGLGVCSASVSSKHALAATWPPASKSRSPHGPAYASRRRQH
jgi:nucleoid DNA-binding protein